MTMIVVELQKWKRNKTVWSIFALTFLLGIFAVNRACSISRSSPLMDQFSDLYTLAFKNLTSLFLPIALGMFATTLFFDEQKNDTLKELWIIPISKSQLYFSKVAVIILMSLILCVFTFAICVGGGFIVEISQILIPAPYYNLLYYTYWAGACSYCYVADCIYGNFFKRIWNSYRSNVSLSCSSGNRTSIFDGGASVGKCYGNLFEFITGICRYGAKLTQGVTVTLSPSLCLISIFTVGIVFTILSIIVLRKRSY